MKKSGGIPTINPSRTSSSQTPRAFENGRGLKQGANGIHKRLLSKPGDGPISIYFNRRISGLISVRLANRMTPNQATLVALLIGALSALLYAQRHWIFGGILLQLSSIFSGVDGEIARLRNKGSNWGDVLDTLTDRFVEYLAIVGMTVGLYGYLGPFSVWSGMLLLGMTFSLTTSSEKFRSATGENYPKREFESYFSWISAGRDARLFFLAIGSFCAVLSPWVLLGIMSGLTCIGHINLLFRLFIMRAHFRYS